MVSLARPRDWWPPIMRGNVYDSVIWSLFYLIYESESNTPGISASSPTHTPYSATLPLGSGSECSRSARPQRLHMTLMIMNNYDGELCKASQGGVSQLKSKGLTSPGDWDANWGSNRIGKLLQRLSRCEISSSVSCSLVSCKCKLFISFNYWQRFSKSKAEGEKEEEQGGGGGGKKQHQQMQIKRMSSWQIGKLQERTEREKETRWTRTHASWRRCSASSWPHCALFPLPSFPFPYTTWVLLIAQLRHAIDVQRVNDGWLRPRLLPQPLSLPPLRAL